MEPIFLTTVLSCGQLLGLSNRIANNSLLTSRQKIEIIAELQQFVPSCPIIIKPYESKRTPSN